MITLHSKYTSIKGCKKKCGIDICRSAILLYTAKTYLNNTEDITICIDGKKIRIGSYQKHDYKGFCKENISISVCNGGIIHSLSTIKTNQYGNMLVGKLDAQIKQGM